MILNWNNQYCQYDYTTYDNLQDQAIPLTEQEQNILNYYRNTEDPEQQKPILEKKNGTVTIRLPDIRLYYNATEIK